MTASLTKTAWHRGYRAGLEAAAELADACRSGVALNADREYLLGIMASDPATAQQWTAQAIGAGIRALPLPPEAKDGTEDE